MRLIATHPEFTIEGTAMILVAPTLIGAFVGLAFVARRRGWTSWRQLVPRGLAAGSIILLGVGTGGLVVATVVPVSLTVTQKRWWPPVRLGLLLVAFFPLSAVWTGILDGWSALRAFPYFAIYRALLYPLLVAMSAGLGRTEGAAMRRARPRKAPASGAAGLA